MDNEDLRYMEYKTMSMHSGRVGETHRILFHICIQAHFFHIGYWALKRCLNSLFWGCYSSSSLCDWYFVHEAASETFLSDTSSSRQQGAVAEQAFPSAWWVWLPEIAPDLLFSSEAQESSEFVNQQSQRNQKWSAALKWSGKSTAFSSHRLPLSWRRVSEVVSKIYLLTYTTLGRQPG